MRAFLRAGAPRRGPGQGARRSAAPRRRTRAIAQPLEGKTVLLVEDSMIIALDAEDALKELGAARVETAANVARALAVLDKGGIDCALLDVNLGGETSLPVARRLQAEGIPFAFATGYGEDSALVAQLSRRAGAEEALYRRSAARGVGGAEHDLACAMRLRAATDDIHQALHRRRALRAHRRRQDRRARTMARCWRCCIAITRMHGACVRSGAAALGAPRTGRRPCRAAGGAGRAIWHFLGVRRRTRGG